jgi:LDH2 family malate/lactate/ureidoglycolate dehydrogenase
MPKVSAEKLHLLVYRILSTAGAPGHVADCVARHLVEADLCGYSTHGVATIPHSISEVVTGRIVPDAEPEVSKTGRSSATMPSTG